VLSFYGLRDFLAPNKLWVLPTITRFFEAAYPQKSPQSFLPFALPQMHPRPLTVERALVYADTAVHSDLLSPALDTSLRATETQDYLLTHGRGWYIHIYTPPPSL